MTFIFPKQPGCPDIPLALRQSPPLINACEHFGLASLDDAQPKSADFSALGTHQDQRLGRYFEDLVIALARTLPSHDLLCRNLVIQADKRTIGELDAVFFNQALNHYEHWEITLKFYLGVAPGHWPGPDPRDTFNRRLNRLRSHQFPLDEHPACQDLLASKGIPRIDTRKLLSRGILFYPAGKTLAAPEGAHPDHARGLWWPADQLPPDWLWQPVPKSQWLFMTSMSDKITSKVDSPSMLEYVEQSHRPVMVNAFSSPHANPTPAFVVPATWLSDAENAYTHP